MSGGCVAILEGSLEADGTFELAPAGGDFGAMRLNSPGKRLSYLGTARDIHEIARFNKASIEVDKEAGVTALTVMAQGTSGDPDSATFQDLLSAGITDVGVTHFDALVNYLKVTLADHAGTGAVTVRVSFYAE